MLLVHSYLTFAELVDLPIGEVEHKRSARQDFFFIISGLINY